MTAKAYGDSMRTVRGLLERAGSADRVSDADLIENKTHILAIVTRFAAVRSGILGPRGLAATFTISRDVALLFQRLDGARAEALAFRVLFEDDEPAVVEAAAPPPPPAPARSEAPENRIAAFEGDATAKAG